MNANVDVSAEVSILRHPLPKGPFRRLALVSCFHQVAALGPLNGDTLLVTGEWLTWYRCVAKGLPCIHLESPLETFPAATLGDPLELSRRGASWMYVDGRDPTLYRGVSLGREFAVHVSYVIYQFERIHYALDQLCDRYRPQEILLVDLHDMVDILDVDTRRSLVADVASRHGAVLIDRFEPAPPDDRAFHFRSSYGFPEARTRTKLDALRWLFILVLDWVSRLGWWLRGKPPVALISVNLLSLKTLVPSRRGGAFAPLVLAGGVPKQPGFILRCLRAGFVLAGLPFARLNRDDRDALARMTDAIEVSWSRDGKPSLSVQAMRHFVRKRILTGGWLESMMTEVKAYDRLFDRYSIRRVVVSDVDNYYSRFLCELARAKGAAADELPNGIFLIDLMNPARCGDSHDTASVSRTLAWGAINSRWLKGIGSSVDCEIVGYPAISLAPDYIVGGRKRALVLPMYACLGDPTALSANVSSTLIETVRVLSDLGFTEIRIKLHPEQHRQPYFDDLVAEMGLPATVFKLGPLAKHVAWADIVVGPLISGSLVETLAAGKPYYPLVPSPSSAKLSYLDPMPLAYGADDLRTLLENDVVPDRDAILETFCSAKSIPNSATRFWQVLEDSVA